jgi:hypothetical protein
MFISFKSLTGLTAVLALAYFAHAIKPGSSKIIRSANHTAVSGQTITYDMTSKGLQQYFEIYNGSDTHALWKIECVSIQDQLPVLGDICWGLKHGIAYSQRFSGRDSTYSSHFCDVGSKKTAVLRINAELFRPWQYGKGSTYGQRRNRYILRAYNGEPIDSFDMLLSYQSGQPIEYTNVYDTISYFEKVKPLQPLGIPGKHLVSYDPSSQILNMRLYGIDKAQMGFRDSSGHELARINIREVATIQVDGLSKGLYSVELHNNDGPLYQHGNIIGHFFKND